MRNHVPAALLALALALPSHALDILVTNDDGVASPGLQALAAALSAAGHDVTVVAPADEQSGQGGSINTDVFGDFVTIVRVAPNQYAVDGSPSDAVNAALNVILADSPPDLVVSGLNRGQNMSKIAANTSGTIGAALRAALDMGVPAIAGSVGILFQESGDDFPSTTAAYGPAAAYLADVVAALEAAPGAALLPKRVKLLNVNFPVPHTSWAGVAFTKLGDRSDLEIPFFDSTDGFPPVFPALGIAEACDAIAVGEFCLAGVGIAFSAGPDTEKDADVDAHRDGFISITAMDGDMTSGTKGTEDVQRVLGGVLP
jgi:3-phytase